MKIKMIKINHGNAWAMVDKKLMPWEENSENRKSIKIYYCNEGFFGIQDGNGIQLFSGEEPPLEEWKEIAHQLYAMLKGWV